LVALQKTRGKKGSKNETSGGETEQRGEKRSGKKRKLRGKPERVGVPSDKKSGKRTRLQKNKAPSIELLGPGVYGERNTHRWKKISKRPRQGENKGRWEKRKSEKTTRRVKRERGTRFGLIMPGGEKARKNKKEKKCKKD